MPAQQHREDWRADDGGKHAERDLGGGDGARERVDGHCERRSQQRRGGQQPAMVVADDQPRRMRDDEADPADDAGDRDLAADDQRDQGKDQPALEIGPRP